MFLIVCRISVLLLVFLFPREAEMQAPTITVEPSSPLSVVEGQSLTLEWTYNIHGDLFILTEFFPQGETLIVQKVIGVENISIGDGFKDRVTANISDSFALITFQTVNRSDSKTYDFKVQNSPGGQTVRPLEIIVQYPPSFNSPSPDQAVEEGAGDITLPCDVAGVPPPNITWTKVFPNGSDSHVLFTGQPYVFSNNRNNAGTYRCKADNKIGSAINQTIDVTINFKPENVQLTVNDSNICKGDVISVSCSADGNPAIHIYQLFENDTLVSNSSSPIAWSKPASTGGVFVYRCEAINLVGTANSTTAVTVNVPPTIVQLSNVTVTEGENRNLTCSVTGSSVPTVSWTAVDSDSRKEGSIRQLTNISRNEDGKYKCDASNLCGNDSKSIYLIVQFKPENVQLTVNDSNICKGDVISVSCSADGNPAVHIYQLFGNDTLVSNSSSPIAWSKPASTGGVFVYRCEANNTVGTASSTKTITVYVPPAIGQLNNITVIEGENRNLTCNVTGSPVPTVSWTAVGSGSRTEGNILQLTNISRNEDGEYKCDASNLQCGNDSKSTYLIVHFSASIVPLKKMQFVTKGGSITLFCDVSGQPAPSVTWTHINSGKRVDNKTWIIDNIGVSDLGEYQCDASNMYGNATDSTKILFEVLASIVPLEETKRVTKDGSITLYCNASGQPPPTVTWTHLDSGKRVNNKTWVIGNIGESDLGEYQCHASNIYGNATDSTKILFEGDRCEKKCTDKQDCLPIGSFYSCLCPDKRKKGTNCDQTEVLKNVVEARIRFKNKVYKEEYNNLEDPVTVKFVKDIEGNCTEEYKAKSKGLKFKKCKVTKLSPGSVIADMELQFDEDVSESQIRVLTQKITEDGSLGQLEVDSVRVGPTPPPPKVEEDCNAFFEGEDCKKAKPALIALCAVAGVVVLALLVAIIACSLHKKKRGGQSFSNGEYGQPRHEPEGHGGSGERNGVNGGNHYDNTAYEQEMQPPTPMVTFTNPSQTPGITVNDSSVTK